MTSFFAVSLLCAAALETCSPGRLFLESDCPTFFAPAETNGVWTLRDWRGRNIRNGCRPADGTISLDPLPPGYYILNVATNEASFAVVRDSPCRNPNSPIAADAAFTWCARRGTFDCPWHDGDTYRVVAELLGRCGLVHTRERMSWFSLNPQPGVYAFDHYLDHARLLRRNGIVTEGIVQSAPAWTGGGGIRMPRDLLALHRFMERAVPAFAPYYDSWEFWNEPELGSSGDPVWEYAAAYKAFALGCRAAPAETVILTGSLSDIDRDGYATGLFDNGIARYADALNIHTYVPPVSLPAWHRRIRDYLAYGRVPHWQIWLTEAGTNLEGHGGRASGRKDIRAHTPDQELVMAEFAPKFQILHLFGGVARTWSFLFGCYNERCGEKDWGMMRRDGSVKPIVSALATLAGEVGDAKLLGERKVSEGVRAFVFSRPNGEYTLAFWSESPVDRERTGPLSPRPDCERPFSLAVSTGAYRLVDAMGTPSEVRSAHDTLMLTANRYPQYLSGLPTIKVDVSAASAGTIERYRPSASEDLTIVLRPVLQSDDFTILGRKSHAELLKAEGRLRLEVWNLSPTEKSGTLSVDGGSIRGIPARVTLSAWGHADYAATYTPPPGDDAAFSLRLNGCFDGRHITPALVPITHRHRFLSQMTVRDLTGASDPVAWRRNDSADHYTVVRDDNALRFDVIWNQAKGKWFYPVYMLTPSDSLKDVQAIEFEVRTSQDKVENDFDEANLMLVGAGNRDVRWLPFASPTLTWERRLIHLPPEAAQAIAFRLGCNPKGRRLSFWLRNVRLLGKKTLQQPQRENTRKGTIR